MADVDGGISRPMVVSRRATPTLSEVLLDSAIPASCPQSQESTFPAGPVFTQ